MFIKGPAAVAQGLREPRSSGDIDVIIDPARFESVVTALTARGWLARFTPADELRAMSGHSVTLVHADWPCDLDLHHFFVGTFAAPAESFEALIEGSETHVIGGRPVGTPSLIGHRLILTINTLRDLGNARADHEAAALAGHFHANPADWNAQVELAKRTRSLSVLHEFARRHDLPDPSGDLNTAELKQLEFVMRYHSQGLGNLRYRLEASDLSLAQKLGVLRRYLYKPASVIRLENPSFEGGVLATLRANFARVGKGVAQWRDARGGRLVVDRVASRTASLPSGREHDGDFRPELPLGRLPYAELRVDGGGVVIANADPTRAVPGAQLGLAPALDIGAVLVPATCAAVQDGETRYLLPIGHAALARDPKRTPGVFRLDAAGQELLDLVYEGVTTPDGLIAEIAARYGRDAVELEPSIIDFLAQLVAAGVIERG